MLNDWKTVVKRLKSDLALLPLVTRIMPKELKTEG